MEAYICRDKDPQGGVYDIYRTMPDMEHLRNTIQEIRKADFPAETWLGIAFAEIKPDPLNHYDEHMLPCFEKGQVVWTREGGFVNGIE